MADTVLYFDKVKLLDGSLAEVCDSTARAAIQGGTYFLGVTTTALTDGATTNPITIAEESVTATNGNVVAYGNKEFVFAAIDSKWHELGDLTNLGALALKDSASGSYTPAGSIDASFSGTSVSYTPAGSVSKPDVDVTPTTASIAEFDQAGSVSTASIAEFATAGSVTAGTANVPTAVTLPTLATTLNGTTLELTWTTGSVTAGTANVPTAVTLPTSKETTVVTNAVMPTSKNTSVVTGVTAALHEAPTFSGTEETISVAGSISATFSGTPATITVS